MNHVPRSCIAALLLSTGSLSFASCTQETFIIPLMPASTTETETLGQSTSGTSITSSSSESGTTTAADSDSGSTTDSVCVPGDAPDDWWDVEWKRRRLLQIDTSLLPGTLANFPLLLRLNIDDLGATWSERSGADLRFRTEDQDIPIAYDIDDVEGGELFVWLRMPQLDPSAGSSSVWMYYDSAAAPAGADAAGIWVDFISVHHLGSQLEDSAGAHHGASAWEPELCDDRCEPRIGLARSFDPTLLHDVVLDNHQDYDLGSDPYSDSISFTITLWMRSTVLGTYPWGALVAKGDDSWRIHTSDFVDPLLDERASLGLDCWLPSCIGIVDGLGNYNLVASSATTDDSVNDGAWHQIAVTVEAVGIPELPPPEYLPDLQARIYIDGAEVAASPLLSSFLVAEDDQPVRFGYNINNAARWGGDLDEVRIATGVRSPLEIEADYITVTNEKLVSMGEEQAWCL